MANYVPDFTLSPDQLIFNLTNHANGGKFQANDLIFSTPEIINDEHYHDQIGVAARNGASFDVDVNSCVLRYNRIDVAHLFSVVGFNVFGAYLGAEIDFTNIAADVLAAYQFNISTGFKIEKRGDNYFLVADTDNPAYYNEVIVDVTLPLTERVPVTMLDGFKYDPGSYQIVPKAKVFMNVNEDQFNKLTKYDYLVRTLDNTHDTIKLNFPDKDSAKVIGHIKSVIIDTTKTEPVGCGGGISNASRMAVSQFHPIKDQPGVKLSLQLYESTQRSGISRMGVARYTDTNSSYSEPSSFMSLPNLFLLPTDSNIADIVLTRVDSVDDFSFILFTKTSILVGKYNNGNFTGSNYISTNKSGRPLMQGVYSILIGAYGRIYTYGGGLYEPVLDFDPMLKDEGFDASNAPEIIKYDTDGSIWISWPEALRKGRIWRINSLDNHTNWTEEKLSRESVLALENYDSLHGSGAYLYGESNIGPNYGLMERIELQLIPKA